MYAQPLLPGRRTLPLFCLTATIALLGLLVGQWPQVTPLTGAKIPAAQQLLNLPLAFMPNVGQAAPAVRMQTSALGGTLDFAPTAVNLQLPVGDDRQPTSLSLIWEGANQHAVVTGGERLPGVVNRYVGDDPSRWHTNVPTYAAVQYRGLYPGIDLRYDGVDGTVKGTYTLAPGADPALIRWHYEGAGQVRVDPATGNLLVGIGDGGPEAAELVEHAPVAWQDINGQRIPVHVRYSLGATTISFALGEYNPAHPLIIDPTLTYSTFLGGGSVDQAHGIAMDGQGNAYLTGSTMSSNFPQATGKYQGRTDLFVAKLSADGSTLLWSTYLGTSGSEAGLAIAVDKDGNAWVTGDTDSPSFPTTPNAHSATHSGSRDTVVVELDAGGQLRYSTYYGYPQFDQGADIAVDPAGNAYMTNTLVTQRGAENIAVVKFAPDGKEIFGVTFGGSRPDVPTALAVDAAGNVYLAGVTGSIGFSNDFEVTANALQAQCGGRPTNCGEDAFVVVLRADAKDFLYATYLGGTVGDKATGIALDPQGNIYVTGSTSSANFPTVNAHQSTCPSGVSTSLEGYCEYYDGFVAKINAASVTGGASSLIFSSFIGGPESSDYDAPQRIVADANGNSYVLGYTSSQNFYTKDAVQETAGGGLCSGFGNRFCFDIFVTAYGPQGGTPVWSTYLGGNDDEYAGDIALNGMGNVLVTGYTESFNYPTTDGAFQTKRSASDEGFVAKIGQGNAPPPPTVTSTTGATSTSTTGPTTGPTSTSTTGPTTGATGTSTTGPTTGPTTPGGLQHRAYLPLVRR